MEVRIYGELRQQCPDVDLDVKNIQQALAGIKQVHGQAVSDHLLSNKYHYFLARESEPNKVISLTDGLLTMSFDSFDLMVIVPDMQGDVYVVAILGVALFTTTSLTVAVIVAAVINIAIALALGFLMQLLSPTPEFDSDPSEAATRSSSSLFNGAPNIREQGGSVPWCMGESNAGGVLISAGMYSEDV